jgi:hypothetical protein
MGHKVGAMTQAKRIISRQFIEVQTEVLRDKGGCLGVREASAPRV